MEPIEKLVEALRSGKYHQGTGKLRIGINFVASGWLVIFMHKSFPRGPCGKSPPQPFLQPLKHRGILQPLISHMMLGIG